MRKNTQWQCRWSPTLGELEATHQKIWGTSDYMDIEKPVVFMGLYSFKDFIELWKHKGEKAILWCGSDITRIINGYWLDEKGKNKIDNKGICQWINKNCENYVENKVEYEALKKIGIKSKIVPSFLGDVKKFEISYKWNKRPKMYTSVSGNDFKLYCWDKVVEIAKQNPDFDFYFYGNTKSYSCKLNNCFFRGRVSKDTMNEEIKQMQGAIRLLPFEGFSEIIAKSLLWGQYPVSVIDYPFTLRINEIKKILNKKQPNIKGRKWVLKKVNNFPWVFK